MTGTTDHISQGIILERLVTSLSLPQSSKQQQNYPLPKQSIVVHVVSGYISPVEPSLTRPTSRRIHAAGRYMASFVIVVVLQGVWDETPGNEGDPRDPHLSASLSCLVVLSLSILLHLVAPHLGGFLLRQLDDVRLARLLRGGDRRYARWGWKTAKECFATSVVFGLCITAAVLSGGWVTPARRTGRLRAICNVQHSW